MQGVPKKHDDRMFIEIPNYETSSNQVENETNYIFDIERRFSLTVLYFSELTICILFWLL